MGGGGSGGGSVAPAPAIEPIKSADESMKSASQATSRAQQLRRGLASTFSRSSMGGATGTAASATSGSGKKLGA